MALTDKIQKIPSKTRTMGFFVFVAALFGLFVYLYHIPMRNEISGLEKDIAGNREQIAKNEKDIKQIDELKAEVKALEEKWELAKKQIPQETEVSGLLRDVQNQVNQSGLTLKLWKPEKKTPHESGIVENIPISMTLMGGYHNLGVFFDRVSKLTRIVNMQNLKMDGAKINKSGAVEINISCTAVTYAVEVEKKDEAASKTPTKKTQ